MKFCEIGVYHHDCWFTNAISKYPEINAKEISGRVEQQIGDRRINTGVYRIVSGKDITTKKFAEYVRSNGKVLEVEMLNEKLIKVTWNAPVTSYDAVLNSGCTIASACYSREGYETYSVFAKEPSEITRLLSEFGQIGEVKIFSMRNSMHSADQFGLTAKQKHAITSAISMGYYEWPKKINLEELAGKLSIKRRTLQENLRKAEGKVLSELLDEINKE